MGGGDFLCKWTKLFDPNYIAGNGRNLMGGGDFLCKWTKLFDPNYIAGNGRNYVTRMISLQMDET